MDADLTHSLQEQVRAAAAARTALTIVGGATKDFYGRRATGQPLKLAGHRGILSHEPTELTLTARAGTPLAEVEAALAEKNQMLGFEPPRFGASATLGGTIACGFSGPRRPYAGAARDFVLGVELLNGQGEQLRFGGQVMKNVAGFDVSRLMAGALGTLGVLLTVSLKVLPRPEQEQTLAFAQTPAGAIAAMNDWCGRPLPLSAAAYLDETLYIRLSGADSAVRAAAARLGGEPVTLADTPWHDLKEQRGPFFDNPQPLWRLSLPPATPPMALPGTWLIDWAGAQRWLKSEAPDAEIRRAATAAGGHATLFRGGSARQEIFTPLPAGLATLHSRLKQAFDPMGILNRGRMYAGL